VTVKTDYFTDLLLHRSMIEYFNILSQEAILLSVIFFWCSKKMLIIQRLKRLNLLTNISHSYLKSDTIQKIKFSRKREKLFFNLTENYWLIKHQEKEYVLNMIKYFCHFRFTLKKLSFLSYDDFNDFLWS